MMKKEKESRIKKLSDDVEEKTKGRKGKVFFSISHNLKKITSPATTYTFPVNFIMYIGKSFLLSLIFT